MNEPPPVPLFARWRVMADRWELRQHLFLPVLASLTTAAILFVIAALLAPQIRRLFSPGGLTRYPLYCVVEPYNGRGDTVQVDLYIINLTDRVQTSDDLERVVGDDPDGRQLSPALVARTTHAMVDSIVRMDSVAEFNQGKGRVRVQRAEATRYAFTVETIDPEVIMRFTLVTNMILPVSSRSNRGSNPIRCEGPYGSQR